MFNVKEFEIIYKFLIKKKKKRGTEKFSSFTGQVYFAP